MRTKFFDLRKINILITALVLFLLTGCIPDPADYTLRTSDEILAYMNTNFPATFTKVSGGVKVEDDNSFPKRITVKFTTNETGDEIITVRHEFAQDNMFGFVNEYFETDFYCILYQDELETYARSLYGNYLDEKYEYKMFVNMDKTIMLNCEDAIKSLDEYMHKVWRIGRIDTVIKGTLNEDPTQDEDYYSLLGRLKKEDHFYLNFYFDPDVDLETVTLESLKQNAGE